MGYWEDVEQPHIAAKIGEAVVLRVGVEGNQHYSIQWKRSDGKDMPEAISHTLKFKATEADDNVKIWAEITYWANPPVWEKATGDEPHSLWEHENTADYGRRTLRSRAVRVKVNVGPVIVKDIREEGDEEVAVELGKRASFGFEVYGKDIETRWFVFDKDGKNEAYQGPSIFNIYDR